MVRLPSEYQEVEYIESTGTQYINTEYIPISSTWAECEYGFSRSYSGEQVMLGVSGSNYNSSNTTGFTIEFYNYARWYCACNGKSCNGVLLDVGKNLNVKHYVSIKDALLVVDGKEAILNGNTNFDIEWPIYLFAINAKGQDASRKTNSTRLYSVKLYENETIKRNFVPCYRKSDDEIGMYDTVSKTFYVNQGTGTFLKGNDVSWDTTSLLERRRMIILGASHNWDYSIGTLKYWWSGEDEPTVNNKYWVDRISNLDITLNNSESFNQNKKCYEFDADKYGFFDMNTHNFSFGNHWRIVFDMSFYRRNSTYGQYFFDMGSVASATKAIGLGFVFNNNDSKATLNWKMLGNDSNPGCSINISPDLIPYDSQYHRLYGYFEIVDDGEYDKFQVCINNQKYTCPVQVPKVFYGQNWGREVAYIGRGVTNGYNGVCKIHNLKIYQID